MMVTVELKTAAVCLIHRGQNPREVIDSLYEFMDEEGLRYPSRRSQASINQWQTALNRATPARCSQILDRKPTYQL